MPSDVKQIKEDRVAGSMWYGKGTGGAVSLSTNPQFLYKSIIPISSTSSPVASTAITWKWSDATEEADNNNRGRFFEGDHQLIKNSSITGLPAGKMRHSQWVEHTNKVFVAANDDKIISSKEDANGNLLYQDTESFSASAGPVLSSTYDKDNTIIFYATTGGSSVNRCEAFTIDTSGNISSYGTIAGASSDTDGDADMGGICVDEVNSLLFIGYGWAEHQPTGVDRFYTYMYSYSGGSFTLEDTLHNIGWDDWNKPLWVDPDNEMFNMQRYDGKDKTI